MNLNVLARLVDGLCFFVSIAMLGVSALPAVAADYGDTPDNGVAGIGLGPGSISGLVYLDLTGDGFSADDSEFADVIVELFMDLDSDGVFEPGSDDLAAVATATSGATGSSGFYEITGLPEARYFVREQQGGLVGWNLVQTDGGDDFATGVRFYTVEITAASLTATGKDFANFETATISGVSFDDLDGDGFAGTNPPFAGVFIHVFVDVDNDGNFEPGGDDGYPATVAVSAADGSYEAAGLAPGRFFLALDPDALTDQGRVQTDGGDNFPSVDYYTVLIDAAGEVETGKDFATFSIGGGGSGGTGTAYVGALENNDSIPAAVPTTLDGSGAASFAAFTGDGVFGSTSGDYDFFALTADQGDTIGVTAGAGPGSVLNTRVALYDASGTRLADDDDSGAGTDSLLAHQVVSAGDYFVVVFASGGGFPADPLTPGTGGGAASTGDYRVEVTITSDPQLLGVAYPTLNATDGARHVTGGPLLGAAVDDEADGQPTFGADGDDLNGATPDDEDGISLLSPLVLGETASLEVTVAGNALLYGWVDFDRDGSWAVGGDEEIFSGTPLVTGTHPLSFSVPATAVEGATYARFRYSTDFGLLPSGAASDGEVEDLLWDITPVPVELMTFTIE